MRGDAILVELFGMPGVGKSSLSHRLAERLAERGVPVTQPSYELVHGVSAAERRARKALHVAREVLLHPLASWRQARLVAGSGQPSPGRALKETFNVLLVSSLARRARRRPGVHLFDQGLVQAAWSVALEARRHGIAEILVPLVRGVPVPDLVAIVTASREAVVARLAGRPETNSRLDRRMDAEPQLLERATDLSAELRETLRADELVTRGVRVLEVANERPDDLDLRAGELADELQGAARELGLGERAPAGGAHASA